MSTRNVSIRKVIQAVLGTDKAAKYFHSETINDTANLHHTALNLLLSGQSEKAIVYIVFGLDIDRNNAQLLHLCKSMMLTISEYLYESNSDFHRKKFPDLSKAHQEYDKKVQELRKKLNSCEKNLNKLSEELENSKPKLLSFKNFFAVAYFKNKKLTNEINELSDQILKYDQEISDLKKSFEAVSPLIKIDEYSRVLSLIIEVCTLPSRFEWVLEKGRKAL